MDESKMTIWAIRAKIRDKTKYLRDQWKVMRYLITTGKYWVAVIDEIPGDQITTEELKGLLRMLKRDYPTAIDRVKVLNLLGSKFYSASELMQRFSI